MYSQMSRGYEKYRPFLYNKARQILEEIKESSEEGWREGRPVTIDKGRIGEESWITVAVANDVIRVMNRKLREKAVVSRIQMDDDAFEFRRSLSKRELREIAADVLEKILKEGSGTLLDEKEKSMVRKLVMRAIH